MMIDRLKGVEDGVDRVGTGIAQLDKQWAETQNFAHGVATRVYHVEKHLQKVEQYLEADNGAELPEVPGTSVSAPVTLPSPSGSDADEDVIVGRRASKVAANIAAAAIPSPVKAQSKSPAKSTRAAKVAAMKATERDPADIVFPPRKKRTTKAAATG